MYGLRKTVDEEEEDVTPELSATQYLRNQTQHRHTASFEDSTYSNLWTDICNHSRDFNLYQSYVVLKYSKYLWDPSFSLTSHNSGLVQTSPGWSSTMTWCPWDDPGLHQCLYWNWLKITNFRLFTVWNLASWYNVLTAWNVDFF